MNINKINIYLAGSYRIITKRKFGGMELRFLKFLAEMKNNFYFGFKNHKFPFHPATIKYRWIDAERLYKISSYYFSI